MFTAWESGTRLPDAFSHFMMSAVIFASPGLPGLQRHSRVIIHTAIKQTRGYHMVWQ